MHAITICQPFASLIADGEKRVENRTWAVRYRGDLAIHAAAPKTSRRWLKEWTGELPDPMPFSAIVAVAELTHCVPFDLVGSLIDEELQFLKTHEHASGPFCWVLERVQRLPDPIACSGQQGLWTPTEDQHAAIAAQLSN